MALAKGREPKDWSAKTEFISNHPGAFCKQWHGPYGFKGFAVYKEKDSEPVAIRPTAERAWEVALMRIR